MISGVQESRHNFRGKLLKFRSGWQLCNCDIVCPQETFCTKDNQDKIEKLWKEGSFSLLQSF